MPLLSVTPPPKKSKENTGSAPGNLEYKSHHLLTILVLVLYTSYHTWAKVVLKVFVTGWVDFLLDYHFLPIMHKGLIGA